MTGNSLRTRGLAVALGVALSGAAVGVATARSPSRGEAAQAAKLFEQGAAAAQDGRTSEAMRLLSDSYALAPVPLVLYNLALLELSTGDHVAAGNHLYRYLETEARLSSDRRVALTQLVETDIRPHAGLIQFTGVEVGALVLVDGQPVGDAGIRYGWWVREGEHEAALPDGPSKQVTVAKGATVLVELLRPKERPSKLPGALTLGLGAGVAIAGGVLLGLGSGAASDVTDAAPATPWTDVKDSYDKAEAWPTTGGVLLGVGGAAVIVGAALLISAASSDEPAGEGAVELTIAPTTGGVVLGGRF
jgi:hypothetical protein